MSYLHEQNSHASHPWVLTISHGPKTPMHLTCEFSYFLRTPFHNHRAQYMVVHVPITLRLCYIHISVHTWSRLQCTYDQTYMYTTYVCKHMSRYRHTKILLSTSCKGTSKRVKSLVKWYYYQFWFLISKNYKKKVVVVSKFILI